MNKNSAKNFKVVEPSGITVISVPTHYDENTLVVLDTSLQATLDMIEAGKIVEVDTDGNVVNVDVPAKEGADDNAPALVEGDACTMPDGEAGTVKAEGENGALVCVRNVGDRENDSANNDQNAGNEQQQTTEKQSENADENAQNNANESGASTVAQPVAPVGDEANADAKTGAEEQAADTEIKQPEAGADAGATA